MQRMQRKVGKLLHRTANEAEVRSLLQQFEETEKILNLIIKGCKEWRDAWADIINHQLYLVTEYFHLYQSLDDPHDRLEGRELIPTPPKTLKRIEDIRKAYESLKGDLLQEISQVDFKLIKPAKDARAAIQPMKKVIKKREDKKLDYEKYQSRVDHMQKKSSRSDRDNTALAKHEIDLARATTEYQIADENLRSNLPILVDSLAVFIPILIAIQVEIQHTLLGTCYTVLHEYCESHGLPPPEMDIDEVVFTWEAQFVPELKKVEQDLAIIAHSKVVHQPMALHEKGRSFSGLNIRGGLKSRRKSENTPPTRPHINSPRPSISSSKSAQDLPGLPAYDSSPTPKIGARGSTQPINRSNALGISSCNPISSQSRESLPIPSPGQDISWGRRTSTSSALSTASAPPTVDYFSRPRIQSTASTPQLTAAASMRPPQSRVSPGLAALGITQKKPPPPPPKPKRIASIHNDFVVAMYDFAGSTDGDLSFKEGDRIRVLKRTESTQDWWEGELNGRRGSFPANYCR